MKKSGHKQKRFEKTYERAGRFEIPHVLAHTEEDKHIFGIHEVKMQSQRYQVFKKSTVCCECGIEASHFWLERHRNGNGERYHFNLYTTNQAGHEVMFTKDHIIPRSRGGADKLENYQTMCEHCNRKKGSKMPNEKEIDNSIR